MNSKARILSPKSPGKPGKNRAGPWQAPVCIPCWDLPVLDTSWAWKQTRCVAFGIWLLLLGSSLWLICVACCRMCECCASFLLKAECSSVCRADVTHVYPFTRVDVWPCPLSDGPEPCCWERACAYHLGAYTRFSWACACFSWVCVLLSLGRVLISLGCVCLFLLGVLRPCVFTHSAAPVGPWSQSLVHALGCTCLLCPALQAPVPSTPRRGVPRVSAHTPPPHVLSAVLGDRFYPFPPASLFLCVQGMGSHCPSTRKAAWGSGIPMARPRGHRDRGAGLHLSGSMWRGRDMKPAALLINAPPRLSARETVTLRPVGWSHSFHFPGSQFPHL